MLAADAAVEVTRAGPHLAGQLLGEPGRLLRDCVANLAARDDLADRPSHLLAVDDPVDELVRPRARERLVDQPVELSARGELRCHALEHVVLDDRLDELLGHRLRQGTVDQARELRNEVLLGRSLEWAARRPRGNARREEGEAPRRAEP